MKKEILVFDADDRQPEIIAEILLDRSYSIVAIASLTTVLHEVKQRRFPVVLWDVDTIPAEIRDLKEIQRINPNSIIIALSERKFHPELEEALRTHFFACLTKPLDPAELIYLLKDADE